MEPSPNPINARFYADHSRYYYSIGGRWSGKTHDAIETIIYRLMVWGGRFAMMRKVYASIRDTLYADTIDFLQSKDIEHTPTVSPLAIRLPNSSIIYKGADDPEKLKGLSSVWGVLMDEANEFSPHDFETIDQSIRGKEQAHSIYLCHNPVPKIPGSQYWFERQFKVDKLGVIKRYKDEDLGAYVSSVRTNYAHNLFCPEHVKKRLEGYKKTNPALYKLWTLGEYAEMKGVILKGWDIVKSAPDAKELIGHGLDFGFSEDPAACVKIWGDRKEIWVKGLLYSTGLTNDELHTKLVDAGIGGIDKIIADSAEPKSIEDLYRRGFRGIRGVKKRANYKSEMANILNGMKIHLIAGDTDLEREVSTWCWDEDKTGKLLPRPKDGNDHYIDAIIMLMHNYRGAQRMRVGGL